MKDEKRAFFSCSSRGRTKFLTLALIALTAGVAAQSASAWTEPGSPAPGGNVGAPINTGSGDQVKSGNFTAKDVRATGGFYKDGRLKADADNNDLIDVGDATSILRYIVGLGGSCTVEICDLTGDGAINIADALKLLRIVQGLESPRSLPLESQAVLRSKPGEIRGDVNSDLIINTGDATELLRNVVGLSSSCTPYKCDMDNNGKVELADALALLRVVSGAASPSGLPFESAAILQVNIPSKPVKGDVNYNGRIDVADVQLILGGAVGLSNCDAYVCDITNDNSVDIADALKLLRLVNGLDASSYLPTESQALMLRKEGCAWITGNSVTCPAAQYSAGIDFVGKRVYCCNR